MAHEKRQKAENLGLLLLGAPDPHIHNLAITDSNKHHTRQSHKSPKYETQDPKLQAPEKLLSELEHWKSLLGDKEEEGKGGGRRTSLPLLVKSAGDDEK